MIHAVKIHNYQSIRDEINVDFTVGKQAPQAKRYVPNASQDTRTAVVQAFMGANASGKTTTLKAIALVRWLIVQSFREDEDTLPVKPFAGHKGDSEPTTLEVVFELNEQVHVYNVSLDSTRILAESLHIRTLTNERVTAKRLFERTWDDDKAEYRFVDGDFKLTSAYWTSKELANASIIAAAQRFGNDYAAKIVEYWRRVETNIEVEDRYGFRPYQVEAYMAARYYENHPESRKHAEADIKKYDLGIEGFGKQGKIRHKYGETSFELEIDQESSGTQQLLVLHKKIERVLEKGGVAVIDELDAYLHPLISKAVIEKFIDESVNTGNGQLIFSTHDVSVFDFLEKYEINIVEKSGAGITSLKRLDSIPGIRNTENFKKRYLQGEYGGIPHLGEIQ